MGSLIQKIVNCLLLIGLMASVIPLNGQETKVPKVYSSITYNTKGQMGIRSKQGDFWPLIRTQPKYTLFQMTNHVKGSKNGLNFDFNNKAFSGTLYYGFIDQKWEFPQPVFYKKTAEIEGGKASIDIEGEFKGKYDMVNWQQKNKGTLGYRVTNSKGKFLYDGKATFGYDKQAFYRDTSIIEGPILQNLQPEGVTVMFKTSFETKPIIRVNGNTYKNKDKRTHHEIVIDGLKPDKSYEYTIQTGDISQNYTFRTAPEKGSRQPFTFAYASDSRAGKGGGERNIKGTNAYIMKKIGALANQEDARFMQFTGDLINGYSAHEGSMNLEYANWKRAVDPFAHGLPINVAPGNHEAFLQRFDDGSQYGVTIDKFPFDQRSAETIFSHQFANPDNGPKSEDGTKYDPQEDEQNFPGYKETAYHYSFGNLAMIVLNSDYWYAPSLEHNPVTSGNLHGYIMNKQMAWLKKTLAQYEKDKGIDHIFITLHTPFFPNGGHVDDDMWYDGQNEYRPIVNGEKVDKGIIERRDQLLDLIVNKNDKVRAILTGDEHNYNRLPIHDEMGRYPEKYNEEKLKLRDSLWQINNGAAGAPYYAQEKTPWQKHVTNFTTQNALVLFHVDGKSIEVEVINPDTLEVFDTFKLN